MRLVFFGPPGAGKGTVASLLDERLKVAHLASGDLLRRAVRDKEPIGQEAQRCMDAGQLVPDDLVTHLMLRHVQHQGPNGKYVLDGFPRTVYQAQVLDGALRRLKYQPIDLAVDFEVLPETAISRSTGRRVCEKCGTPYHIERLKPRKEGICDRCAGKLIIRADDQPETVVKRLDVYHRQTQPLLDFYKTQDKWRLVSGESSVEQQYQTVIDLLKREHLIA